MKLKTMKLAYIGKTDFNINGNTIHPTFHNSVKQIWNKLKGLNEERHMVFIFKHIENFIYYLYMKYCLFSLIVDYK